MVSIIVFHGLMLLLALGILARIIPAQRISSALGYLHNTIGITTPPPNYVRVIALVWLGSIMVMVDGCVLLTVLITSLTHASR